MDLTDRIVLSVGAKFEDSDLTGSTRSTRVRLSYTLDEQNIFGELIRELTDNHL